MNFSHLRDVGESYSSHMVFSLKLFLMLSVLAYAALIHAVVPFLMVNTVSKRIDNIQDALASRS